MTSWAQLAAKNKDKPECAEPRVVVRGGPASPRATELEKPAASTSPQRAGYSGKAGDAKRRLVLDTGALIRGSAGLMERADVFVTVREVLQEARDKRTREWLETLPFELEVLEPSRESVEAVVQVARRTGDYGTLSAVDLRVCALAHTVAKEHGALVEAAAPQKHPQWSTGRATGAGEQDKAAGQPTLPGWGSWEDPDSGDEGEEEAAPAAAAEAAAAAEGDADAAAAGAEEEEEEEEEGEGGAADADEGWITPANIAEVTSEGCVRFGEAGDGRSVGCMTTDFPMQNVLMHVGVLVVSVHGYAIKHLKRWILRCHCCYSVVRDTTRQFCPDCGSGNTLKRVSYTINDQGEEEIWINPRKRINVRGTRFNLPKPRGGRSGTNKTVVLREDQLRHNGRQYNRDDLQGDAKVASMLSDDWMWAGQRDDGRAPTHLKPTASMHARTKGRNPNNGRRRKV